MKSCMQAPVTFRQVAVSAVTAIALLVSLISSDSEAAPWQVDVQVQPPGHIPIPVTAVTTESITSPVNPERRIVTNTTYTTVQSSTDIPLPAGFPLPLVPAGTVRLGLDSYFSDKQQIFNLPLGYSFTDNLYAELVLPVGTVYHQNGTGAWLSDGSIGDVALSGRYVLGSGNLGLGSTLTMQFPSGDPEKGLGTGTYDLSLTEKVVYRRGLFLFTGLLGYTYRMGAPTIYGQSVTFGDTFAWMVSGHLQAWLDRLWVGLKVCGTITSPSKIQGAGQGDGLTTVDLVPEMKFFFTKSSAVTAGVMIPVATRYDVPGRDDREVVGNIGLFTLF